MELAHSDLSLDWLSFTYNPVNFNNADDYDYTRTFDYFMDKFPEFQRVPDMIFLDRVWSHYRKAIQLNMDILIHFDDSESNNKGVCVQVSSNALPYLFSLFNCNSVQDLFILLKDRGAKFTRIDLAFDDFTKSFLPYDFWEFYNTGCLVTRIKHLSWYSSGNKSCKGQTFYAGNRSSDKFLRIYDKEVESHGQISSVRYEFELKKNICESYAAAIINGDQIDFISLITQYFRVINPDSSTRTNTADLLDEWESFCKNLKFNEVVPLLRKSDSKKSARWRWFKNQVAPSLSVEFHNDPDMVITLLLDAFYDLQSNNPKKLRRLINNSSISDDLYDNDFVSLI